MTRDNFLGFGCSATSLFKEQFKINTFDVDSYCERIRSGNLATSLTIRFTKRQRMVYWLFWTAYSTRVTAEDFEKFFGVSLKKMYGFELWVAKQLGLVKEHNGTYEMTQKVPSTIITMRIFTHYLISTRCGVSCEKKHFPNRLNCKRTEIAQCQTTGIVSDRYRSNSS